MRGWLAIGAGLLFTAAVVGCDNREGTGGRGSAASDGSYRIAVIPKGTTHEFWKSVHAGARKAAQEHGVEIVWKGPLKEDDRDSQISTVENFITAGVDGIVLAPLDDAALQLPVRNAQASDIPVVIIDSGLKGDEYVSFVATDNYKGGQMAGEHLVGLLGGKGRVVVLRYQEGSASTAEREQGFLDAVAKVPGVELVSANQYGGATTETAYRASENLLAPLKGADGKMLTVDGIFTPNESTTFGMLRALQEGGHAGNVKFVGFDASPKLVEALEKGQIHALVLQNPMKMGYEGVRTMVQHLKGQDVPKRIDTGVALATPQNMNEPQIKQVLNPDLGQ